MTGAMREGLYRYRVTPSALATPVVMARTCGLLYVLGAGPGVAISAAMPAGPGKAVVVSTVALSFVIGVWMLVQA